PAPAEATDGATHVGRGDRRCHPCRPRRPTVCSVSAVTADCARSRLPWPTPSSPLPPSSSGVPDDHSSPLYLRLRALYSRTAAMGTILTLCESVRRLRGEPQPS